MTLMFLGIICMAGGGLVFMAALALWVMLTFDNYE